MGSALANWSALMRYVEQGYLAIDNNVSERALRQLVVGQGNWQFCGSAEGGRTAAALYSVVGTCWMLPGPSPRSQGTWPPP